MTDRVKRLPNPTVLGSGRHRSGCDRSAKDNRTDRTLSTACIGYAQHADGNVDSAAASPIKGHIPIIHVLTRAVTAEQRQHGANVVRDYTNELEWLGRQRLPMWGGHLERGEPVSDPMMQHWIAEGLIEAVEKPCQGYVRLRRAGNVWQHD